MTPPKRNEDVISEKSKGLKSQNGGVDVDELEAYLRKNQAPSPPKVKEASFKIAAEPLPKSKDSSFSEKDKAGFYEQPREKALITHNLTVTPLSDFHDVHSFLSTDDHASDKFFVRNFANNGSFQTRYYGYKQGLIFEVIPDKLDSQPSGQIASV